MLIWYESEMDIGGTELFLLACSVEGFLLVMLTEQKSKILAMMLSAISFTVFVIGLFFEATGLTRIQAEYYPRLLTVIFLVIVATAMTVRNNPR